MGFFRGLVEDTVGGLLDLGSDILDLGGDILEAVGDGIEAIGDTIQGIIDDPLPTLLQIGGSLVGIPPYVTAAVITASKGGDLGDIAKSAAISYASTSFIQGTEIGKTIGDFTKQAGADFTSTLAENFDLPLDVASSVSKAATASLNSAIIGGVNAAISGKDVMSGITGGFTSGLIYSSTDSYFDSLNKDPSWGFSKTSLDLMKGATSTALNTLASGKGDPAQAVGNYIAYATLKLGSSELYKKAQSAYDDFSGATEKAVSAQDKYLKAKAEFDTKYTKYQSEVSVFNKDAEAFNQYVEQKFNPVKDSLDDLKEKQEEQIRLRQAAIDRNDIATANTHTAKANEYGTQAKKIYDDNKSVIDKVGEMKTALESKAGSINQLLAEIQQPDSSKVLTFEKGFLGLTLPKIVDRDNTAKILKDAADEYQVAYDALKNKEGVANRAAENYNKIVAEIATRDATIDALNTGAIKVDSVSGDGTYTLSNGMTMKDGKFYQNGQQAFTNAGGIEQKDLNFKDSSGNTVMYDSSAGRLMSDSDIKQLFRRDYGYDLTDEQAKQFVGKDYNTVDTQKLQDIAISRIEEEFKAITRRNPTKEEINAIKDQDDVVSAAQNSAVNALDLPDDYVSPGASQNEKISYGAAYAASRTLYGPGSRFEWLNPKTGKIEIHIAESKEEKADRLGREAAAAQARIDMLPAYGEAGAGRGFVTPPADASKYYVDNNTGDVLIDDRKFDRYGNVISGTVSVAPPTTALNVAKALFVDAGAQLTDAFAGAAKFLGVMDRNGETSRKVKQLTDYAESIKPAEVKAESQAFWDGLAKVKGIPDTVAYIANSVVDKPLMTGFNITSEIIQTLGTMGAGAGTKYAAKVLQAAPAIAAKLGIGVDMVLNVAESAGASYNDAYSRERKLLENYVKAGVMTEEAADAQAADKANKAFMSAGAITGAILNVPGGNALSKQVLKDTASAQAMEAAYKTAIKTGAKEAVSEGLEAGAIEAAVQKIIKPDADLNWKDIVSTGMLESIYGGGHSTVIAGADASLSNLSQRLANVGVSQSEIDLIRKGIAESVYDGGTTLKQDRETVANFLMDKYGYTEGKAQAISNALVDSTALVTVNSFLRDIGLDTSKIDQISPQLVSLINSGSDINTVASNVGSLLQNAGIEANQALNYTKAFMPTAAVKSTSGQLITAPTVQISKPADLTSVVTASGGTNPAGDSTNVGGSTGTTQTTTGQTTPTGTNPTITSKETLPDGNTSVTYSNGNVVVFDKNGVPISGGTATIETGGGDVAVTTDLGGVTDAITDLKNALASAQQGNTNAFADITKSLEALKSAGLTTDQVQNLIDTSLNTTNETLANAIAEANKGNTKALTTLETNLTDQIGDLNTDVQTKFDALTEAQKAEALSRAAMGESLSTAIEDVSTNLQESITDLGTDVNTKFDALTESQADMKTQFNTRVDELVEQGKTFQEATDLALKEINTDIGNISTEQARQEAGRRIAQKAAAEKSAREKGLASAAALVATDPERPTDQDPAKFKKPFQTSGEGEKFQGPLDQFLKQARQGSFIPQQGQQSKQVPITEVTDRLDRPAGQPGQTMQPQEGYYNYGQSSDIDQILNPEAVNESMFQKDTLGAKAGGLMSTPMMATGGTTRYGKYAGGGLNIVNHSGKARVDFRQGDAVTGPGDGQSDDIPAMLADGEFVIPADVVASLGNGSTKAGSDKLYDMMHSIRAYHRSAKPKDLPPPAKKSPLDYLKESKRKARR